MTSWNERGVLIAGALLMATCGAGLARLLDLGLI
jgi:hypothetical protein